MKPELGDEVKCRATGFTGIVTGHHRWISGCDTYTVQPPCGKDGKIPDREALDETMLEIVKRGKTRPADRDASAERRGGPKDHPRAPGAM